MASISVPGLFDQPSMSSSNLVSVGLPTDVFVAVTLLVMSFLIVEPPYRDEPINNESVFDFIVVGGGSAGCIVAAKLAENLPDKKVLLLEAGPAPSLKAKIPWMYIMEFPEADWNYVLERQEKGIQSRKPESAMHHSGRILGGSGAVNGMIYVWGHPKDYDSWKELGNQGWGYEEISKSFREIERVNLNSPLIDEQRRGHNGRIEITNPKYIFPISKEFLEAGKSLGYDVGDYNIANKTVFSYWQNNIQEDGLRANTERTFLRPAAQRLQNLKISLNTLVHKVIIDGGNRISGVVVEKGGKVIEIKSQEEVILSAGSIGSPKILMLSGIGPAKHLQDLGISVISDLPVGENYHDHVAIDTLTWLVNCTECVGDISYDANTETILEYATRRTGPLARRPDDSCLAFVNSGFKDANEDWPDIMIILEHEGAPNDLNLRRSSGEFKDEVYESYLKPWGGKPSFGLQVVLQRPKSVGWLKLRSNDVKQMPIIQPNYLQQSDDIEVLLAGLKKALEIADMIKRNTGYVTESSVMNFTLCIDGPEKYEPGTDDYFRCYIRWMTMPFYHVVGTCRMGPLGDKQAVVDPELKVHGVEGLRVVDASVMPNVPSANTNGPTMAVANIGADIIIKNHRRREDQS